jgi:hypothetical protein
MRYRLAEALCAAVYPKFKFSEFGRLFLEDTDVRDIYVRGMDPGNWHSLDRKYTLYQLARLTAPLTGDIAECGVFKGVSALLMCRALQGTGAVAHLFDSFEGLSDPGPQDGSHWSRGDRNASEQEVIDMLSGIAGYRLYRGWIPDRFAEIGHLTFRLVRIDVDLYQPTLDSIAFFYERITPGGFLLLDDYGFTSCPGAKQAADEFFADKPERIAMLSTGQALAIKSRS